VILRDWLAGRLTYLAASRLRRSHPDWARAILSEHESLAGQDDRLLWALGTLRASLTVPAADVLYPAILILAVSAMVLYQWSWDEGAMTWIVLGGLSACLGFLCPKQFLLSGLAIGLVVAAVTGFESLSGIRPAYEIHPHTLAHCLRWLILVIPGLISSAMGRQIRLHFHLHT
jgi:hypothetical protein